MVSIYMNYGKFNNYYVKLFLYVIIASLTALLSDLHQMKCYQNGDSMDSPLNLVIVFLNFILQGCIAWRAFIDQTSSKTDQVALKADPVNPQINIQD